MTGQPEREEGQPGVASAALSASCPRCGARKALFDGVIAFASRCRACGLDFTRFNVGDGPAGFLTLIVGALITILAVVVDMKLSPPFWVHVILWVPLTVAAVTATLRVSKAALLILEYRRGAGEGREKQ